MGKSLFKPLLNAAFALCCLSAAPGAFATDPSAVESYGRGCTEAANGNYEAAIAAYNQAIEKNPQYWEAFGNRSSARFNIHDYNGALSDVQTSLAHFPGNAALLKLKAQTEEAIANANVANQNAEEFRRRANQMLLNAQLGGDFADPSTMIMMQAQRRGLIPNTEPTIPIRPAQPPAPSNDASEGDSPFAHSSGTSGTGPFSGSDSYQDGSKTIPPTSSAIASRIDTPASLTAQQYFDRGCDKAGKLDWVGAIKEYDQAIALDPNFGKAFANRGSARFNSSDRAGALSDFDNAVRLMPDNPAVKSVRDQIARALGK